MKIAIIGGGNGGYAAASWTLQIMVMKYIFGKDKRFFRTH